MPKVIKSIVIVGAGSAGWITAGLLANKFKSRINQGKFSITVCESPSTPIVGVGEGTWPTMVETLKKIGVSETEFIRSCDVSFKQGSKFVNWESDSTNSYYYHPFESTRTNLEDIISQYWLNKDTSESIAKLFTPQESTCDLGLAPKTITSAEFDGNANYGYHLDATKFSVFLQNHCTTKLNVHHILDDVMGVNLDDEGFITSLKLDNHDDLSSDFFIDCTGFKSLLMGDALNIGFNSIDDVLFADTALATQVKYPSSNHPIASYTQSTATDAGWIWDIGLPTRRGVGHVFSKKFMSVNEAKEKLCTYIEASGGKIDDLTFREINFKAGHREKFWHKNCVAVGLSAGFLEPLEASALVLIELSAMKICDLLPSTQDGLAYAEERFNQKFKAHWKRAIEFLKLHYILSHRTSPFWEANRDSKSIPDRLIKAMSLWKNQVPTAHDFEPVDELFNFVNYQFVLYGSGFKSSLLANLSDEENNLVLKELSNNEKRTSKLLERLPSNRELLEKINKFGLSKI